MNKILLFFILSISIILMADISNKKKILELNLVPNDSEFNSTVIGFTYKANLPNIEENRIPDVYVTLDSIFYSDSYSQYTSNDTPVIGLFKFHQLAEGNYQLTMEKEGYEIVIKNIYVNNNEETWCSTPLKNITEEPDEYEPIDEDYDEVVDSFIDEDYDEVVDVDIIVDDYELDEESALDIIDDEVEADYEPIDDIETDEDHQEDIYIDELEDDPPACSRFIIK